MADQPDLQKHLHAEIGRLVLELVTAKAIIEHLEGRLAHAARTEPEASPSGSGSGRSDGARGADGPTTE